MAEPSPHRSRSTARWGALLATLICASWFTAAEPLRAQQAFVFVPRVQPEWRADLVVARRTALLAMAGANVPLGYYLRAGAALGAGTVWRSTGAALATRADITARFLLDPFGEAGWGPYVGGGLTATRERWERPHLGLLLVLGVEGRRRARWTPSVELGLGEGARLGVVLRRSRKNGR